MQRLLLISSSKTHGSGFLDHCGPAIRELVSDRDRVLFIPYALADRDQYADLVRGRLAEWGLRVDSIHQAQHPREAVAAAQAVFIGGGNTFRLLRELYRQDLISVLQRRVAEGMPYMGSSAGTNMACPTIRTSNDMPIVEPPSFEALGLVPFQINPHFLDADPDTKHQGESRELRLREYLEENERPVLAIREGSWLTVDGTTCRLHGETGAVVFRRGHEPAELRSGAVFEAEEWIDDGP